MQDERIQELKERAEKLIEAIGYMEDRQGFAPKDLMEEYHACIRELKNRKYTGILCEQKPKSKA